MKLREANFEEQLLKIKNLYYSSFPKDEQKPFAIILKKRDEGLIEIFSIENASEDFMGLAITVLHKDIVLLDYFAIVESARGNGSGSRVLELLYKKYWNKRLILEIESTRLQAGNLEERILRKNFYIKNGMAVMPFMVNLFGVVMEILTYRCDMDYKEYIQVYRSVFGNKICNNIKLASQD